MADNNNGPFFDGQKITSYDELSKMMNEYERTTKYQLVVTHSKSLVNVFEEATIINFNPELVYNEIDYQCSINKNVEDIDELCPVDLKVKLSPKKQNFVLSIKGKHNHDPPASLSKRRGGKYYQLLEQAKEMKKKFDEKEKAKEKEKAQKALSKYEKLLLKIKKCIKDSNETERAEKIKQLQELSNEFSLVSNDSKFIHRKFKYNAQSKNEKQTISKRGSEEIQNQNNSLPSILNILDDKMQQEETKIHLFELQHVNRDKIKNLLTIDELQRWEHKFEENAYQFLKLTVESCLKK